MAQAGKHRAQPTDGAIAEPRYNLERKPHLPPLRTPRRIPSKHLRLDGPYIMGQ